MRKLGYASRDVKKYIEGAEEGKSHRSSHKEPLRLHTATTVYIHQTVGLNQCQIKKCMLCKNDLLY